MRKLILGILVVAVCFSFLSSEEYDIRKLKWGMSYSEVRAAENLGNEFYKSEDVLGAKVEVVFNIDTKGLRSVSYSTRNIEFHTKAQNVLVKKYGEPGEDLDYTFLVQSKSVLKTYPDEVLEYMKNPDLAVLNKVTSREGKLVFRVGLAKREVWKYKNTIALLIASHEGVILNYRSKEYHDQNKKKFDELLKEIKALAKNPEQKESEDVEKL